MNGGRPRVPTVLFAVPEEAAPFRRRMAGRPDLAVVVTGMGRRNALRALERLLSGPAPGLIMTCGFAGGLDPEAVPGSLFFDTADLALGERLRAAGARLARFHCAERIAVTAAEKAALRRQTGADAVEMESGWIREACSRAGAPSATLRVILDPAHQDLPLDFNALATPEQRIDPLKLAAAILRRPGKIPALLALQRQSREAAEALASALSRFFAY